MARSRDDAVGVVPVWLDLREGVLQDTLGIVVERLAQLAVLNQQPKSLDVKPLLHRHLRSLLHHLLNPLITQLNHGADADGKLVLSADALKRRMLELLAEVSQRAGEVFLKLAAPLQRNNNLLALIARIDRGGLKACARALVMSISLRRCLTSLARSAFWALVCATTSAFCASSVAISSLALAICGSSSDVRGTEAAEALSSATSRRSLTTSCAKSCF
eukprot:CAMPEP_0173377556 /NCGR_PEP_ID=MMETSP1356-20130122/805_1 /TAXON_ID=77927 ORGANISM="Hemiselmis virescens, Strain PCC157" /NCGR_SAMPLE_ID=MMETSP1356 /ASSEMBLY_ACC=CAM_ASM_000847 /LENGTH=217 /DNA_ID=CAMNT_0014330347 /DNA_START=63 /DNA_END=717 /DNA_ORIENTATION=-